MFVAIWAGLFGVRLVPTRPILGREILAIRGGVLFGVLIFPVLLLTLFSLWLHGFGAEEIGVNLWSTTLAVMPVWIGLALFSRLAGSFKITVAGIVVLSIVVAIADSNRIRGLAEPWINVVGSWQSSRYIVASWVTVVLLSVSWLFLKNRNTGKRMVVACLCVIAGWAAIPWTKKRESVAPYSDPLSESVQWNGVFQHWVSSEGPGYKLGYEQLPLEGNRFVVWQLNGGFGDGNGMRAKATYRKEADIHRRLDPDNKKLAALRLLDDGDLYFSDRGSRKTLADRELSRANSSFVSFTLPKEMSLDEGQVLSGTLAGAICETEQLVDSPMGTGVEFQRGDVDGRIQWLPVDDKSRSSVAYLELFVPLRSEYGYDGSWNFPWDNWIFHLCYPKAGVVIAGQLGNKGWDQRIGGVQKRTANIEFETYQVARQVETMDEIPRLKIYRVKVVKTGHCEVELPRLRAVANREPNYALSLVESHEMKKGIPSEIWKLRPDPQTATRAEVGGWMRVVDRYMRSPNDGSRDLVEFADPWGDLLIESGKKVSSYLDSRRHSAFVDGAGDRWQTELVAALGEVKWAPEALVERGWAEAARGKVTELLAAGNRDEEILKLAVLLEIPEAQSAVVEKIPSSRDRELSQIFRRFSRESKEWNATLDRKLASVDSETRYHWETSRAHQSLRMDGWAPLLSQGRTKDLEKFLEWVRRYEKGGRKSNVGYHFRLIFAFSWDYQELKQAKKLEAKYFRWDPVLLKWDLREKGEAK